MTTTEKYTQFMNKINEIETRKQTAEDEERQLKKLLNKQNDAYAVAEMGNQPTDIIKADIAASLSQLKDLEHKLSVLTRDPKTILDIIKKDKNIVQQAKEIFDSNTKDIEEMQKNYDAKILQLQEIKRQYLQMVGELGKLVNDASTLAKEKNQVGKYMPERGFCIGLKTDYQELRKTGSMFMLQADMDTVFKRGDF